MFVHEFKFDEHRKIALSRCIVSQASGTDVNFIFEFINILHTAIYISYSCNRSVLKCEEYRVTVEQYAEHSQHAIVIYTATIIRGD